MVQQITRYYHGLKTEQPLKELVDYSQPIRLIAIAPDFHKHNFIDRRYSVLKIEFARFTILNQTDRFYVHFLLEGRKEVTIQEPIPFVAVQEQPLELPELPIEPPSRMLLNVLDDMTPLAKAEILRLREKILKSDRRIKEIKDGKNIFYGRGKTKSCCQLKLVPPNKYTKFELLQIYLWLPIEPHLLQMNQKYKLGRMSLKYDVDFKNVKTLTYWTQTLRTPIDLSMPADVYLEQLGLETASSSIEVLLDIAIKLNLERK